MTRMQNLYSKCLNMCNKELLIHQKRESPVMAKRIALSAQNSKNQSAYRERTLPLPRKIA